MNLFDTVEPYWELTGAYSHKQVEALLGEINSLRAEVASLKEENAKLCSVMIAAAEEIHEHWDAHCDEEGYGPSNLMHRLENGLSVSYLGYSAGAFQTLTEQNTKLVEALKSVTEDFECSYRAEYSREPENKSYDEARKLIAALTPQPENRE